MRRYLIGLGVFIFGFSVGQIFVPPRTDVGELLLNRSEVVDKTEQIQPITVVETIDDDALLRDDLTFQPKMHLLETGTGYQPGDITAKNGETWLGLFWENGRYVLRPAKVNIAVVKIRMEEEYEGGDGRRKNVSVQGPTEPLFLLKDARKIRKGDITGLLRGLTWPEAFELEKQGVIDASKMQFSFVKDFSQKFETGGNEYELKVTEAKNKDNKAILALIIEGEGKRQVLHTTFANNGFLGNLYWVGDLDRDGKPDLYMSLWENEVVHNAVLFLSSESEKENLVKKIANFWTASGC